jgi:hypothetical protein
MCLAIVDGLAMDYGIGANQMDVAAEENRNKSVTMSN